MPAGMGEDCRCLSREFTQAELAPVLRQLKKRKAAGTDEIANEMLTHLGRAGREALLRVVNASWQTAVVPGAWRVAEALESRSAPRPPARRSRACPTRGC